MDAAVTLGGPRARGAVCGRSAARGPEGGKGRLPLKRREWERLSLPSGHSETGVSPGWGDRSILRLDVYFFQRSLCIQQASMQCLRPCAAWGTAGARADVVAGRAGCSEGNDGPPPSWLPWELRGSPCGPSKTPLLGSRAVILASPKQKIIIVATARMGLRPSHVPTPAAVRPSGSGPQGWPVLGCAVAATSQATPGTSEEDDLEKRLVADALRTD